jgi:DNA-dependent RNA polymerase auxiliary subunit epsilon
MSFYGSRSKHVPKREETECIFLKDKIDESWQKQIDYYA